MNPHSPQDPPGSGSDLADAVSSGRLERLRAALASLEEGPVSTDPDSLVLLVRMLGHADKQVRRRASGALERIAPAHETEVAAAMESIDPLTRWGAAFALQRCGLRRRRAAEVALETLANADGDVRWAAASLLTDSVDAWPDLPERLGALVRGGAESSPVARKMAVFVLRDLGRITVGDCEEALRAPEAPVRLAALAGFARLQDVPESTLGLVAAVAETDPNVGVRRAAVAILGRIGATSPAVFASLQRAGNDGDADVARAARAALSKYGK